MRNERLRRILYWCVLSLFSGMLIVPLAVFLGAALSPWCGAAYVLGIFITLVKMLWQGETPEHWGSRRPFTAEEYFIEPLVWPAGLLWWVIILVSRT